MNFNRLFQRNNFVNFVSLIPKRTKKSVFHFPCRFEHSGSSESIKVNRLGSTQLVFPFISRTSQEPDETLRLIFDDLDFWNNFTSRSQTLAALEYSVSLSTGKLTG